MMNQLYVQTDFIGRRLKNSGKNRQWLVKNSAKCRAVCGGRKQLL